MFGKKFVYLKELTSRLPMRSVSLGRDVEGSTPPSVFIGSWNYPKVFAGPMISQQHGDTSIFDSPESWIPANVKTHDVVNFRMNLIRGKREVDVTNLDNKLVEKLVEISMAVSSIESEAHFSTVPLGRSFSDEHTPYGPSAVIDEFDIENCRWDNQLEKVYYDTDLKAADAVMQLYEKDVPFSRIQKAFSVGTMGGDRRRKLVPTRWSITACDMTLADRLLKEVRHYNMLDCYRVHEFDSLNNYYAVILLPTAWQYEWIEAFLHVLRNEELIFADHETNRGKDEYSIVGGCYYSCKFSVLEALARKKKQAGAIILREAYQGYVPLGVFNVRENVRSALAQKGREFNSLRDVMEYLKTKLRLPVSRFVKESTLLKEQLRGTQTNLRQYA